MSIIQKIHAVMREVKGLREEKNSHHRYLYVPHDEATSVLHDAFVKHGIVQSVSVREHTRSAEDLVRVKVEVTWLDVDAEPGGPPGGTGVTVEAFGEAAAIKGTIADLQIGKAVSYAVKYAQMKTFMLVGGERDSEADDLGEVSGGNGKEKPKADGNTIESFLKAYEDCPTLEEFEKLRKLVGKHLNEFTFSPADYDKLERADARTEGRLVK